MEVRRLKIGVRVAEMFNLTPTEAKPFLKIKASPSLAAVSSSHHRTPQRPGRRCTSHRRGRQSPSAVSPTWTQLPELLPRFFLLRARLLRRTSVANQDLPPLYRPPRSEHASTMEAQPPAFATQIDTAAPQVFHSSSCARQMLKLCSLSSQAWLERPPLRSLRPPRPRPPS